MDVNYKTTATATILIQGVSAALSTDYSTPEKPAIISVECSGVVEKEGNTEMSPRMYISAKYNVVTKAFDEIGGSQVEILFLAALAPKIEEFNTSIITYQK